MADYKFFADMCIAICVDCNDMKEIIIYGEPKKVFKYINGDVSEGKSVQTFKREIGSFLCDLSSDCKMQNYLNGCNVTIPDDNVTCIYLKMVIDKVNSNNLLSDDDEEKWLNNHLDITQTPLIDKDFEYNQRHFSYTPSRVPNTNQAIDCLLGRHVKDNMPMMIMRDKNGVEYAVTDVSLVSMVEYYIRLLYSKNLFPRYCLNCGKLFIAKSSIFDVLCSDACKKQRNSEKIIRYKEKHNDEFEAQYMKVYQRWYTRIRRAKEKGQLTGDKLQLCDNIFSNFASESYEKRNAVRSGEISPEAYLQWINEFDNRMNIVNDRDLSGKIQKE